MNLLELQSMYNLLICLNVMSLILSVISVILSVIKIIKLKKEINKKQ